MVEPRCTGCLFVLVYTNELGTRYFCRRFPPVPLLAAAQLQPSGDYQITVQPVHPQVGEDYWCGEFQAKPTVLQ